MPSYDPSKTCTLQPGDKMALWNAETPSAPAASVAFARGMATSGSDQGSTFQVHFPGTASVQIQAANIDNDASYTNVGTAIATSGGSYTNTERFAFYRAQVAALTGGNVTVVVQR